jgi:hypothetical protein
MYRGKMPQIDVFQHNWRGTPQIRLGHTHFCHFRRSKYIFIQIDPKINIICKYVIDLDLAELRCALHCP